jgi:hypothetical protein
MPELVAPPLTEATLHALLREITERRHLAQPGQSETVVDDDVALIMRAIQLMEPADAAQLLYDTASHAADPEIPGLATLLVFVADVDLWLLARPALAALIQRCALESDLTTAPAAPMSLWSASWIGYAEGLARAPDEPPDGSAVNWNPFHTVRWFGIDEDSLAEDGWSPVQVGGYRLEAQAVLAPETDSRVTVLRLWRTGETIAALTQDLDLRPAPEGPSPGSA